MKPVELSALPVNSVPLTIAKDQPPYLPLPAAIDQEGTIMTEWECSAEDLARLMNGGRLRVWICYTQVHLGKPFTPLAIEVVEA